MKVTVKDFVPALAVAPNKNGGTASAGSTGSKSSSLSAQTPVLPLNDEDIVFPKKIAVTKCLLTYKQQGHRFFLPKKKRQKTGCAFCLASKVIELFGFFNCLF